MSRLTRLPPFSLSSGDYEKQLGQGLTEYLILLVLISLVSIAAVRSLGGTIQGKLTLIRNHIEKVSIEK